MTAASRAKQIIASYQSETGGTVLSALLAYSMARDSHVVRLLGTKGNYDEPLTWPDAEDVFREIKRITTQTV